jgi:hypothetical protein
MEFDYWKKEIRYYEIGLCDHEGMYQKGVNVGKCLNTYTCPKCGMKHTLDSSN